MSKSIAYVRVSTIDQNLDRQMIAMSEYGIPEENIFADHGFSGKALLPQRRGVCIADARERSPETIFF